MPSYFSHRKPIFYHSTVYDRIISIHDQAFIGWPTERSLRWLDKRRWCENLEWCALAAQRTILTFLTDGLSVENECSLCKKTDVNDIHVLSNCKDAADRYKWRHDSVARLLADWLKGFGEHKVFANDLQRYTPIKELLKEEDNEGKLPGIIVETEDKYYGLELTVCNELSLDVYKYGKKDKFKGLTELNGKPLTIYTLEVSSFGLFNSSPMEEMMRAIKREKLSGRDKRRMKHAILRITQVVTLCSHFIYTERVKPEWKRSSLLHWTQY